MKIYDQIEQIKRIDYILDNNTDSETSEILLDAKKQLINESEETVNHYLDYICELKSKIEFYKSEAQRIISKARTLEKRADWIKTAVESYLCSSGENKKEIGTYTIAIRKNPAKVVVDDEYLLPDEYCSIVRTPIKTKLKELMNANGEFIIKKDNIETKVAHLEQSESLSIK